MLVRKETVVIPVDSREEVLAQVRAALADAPADERPGLERALRLVEDLRHDDAAVKGAYARRLLESAGVDPVQDKVRAIRTLREQVPGLGLAAAVDLWYHATA